MSTASIVRIVAYGVVGGLLGAGGIAAVDKPLLFIGIMAAVVTIDIASSLQH